MNKQSLQDMEAVLFSEWKKTLGAGVGFAPDGVVDEVRFLASPLKLFFVLKEVNDPGGMGFDLREYMNEGARGQTWNNITRWTEGLHYLKLHGRNIRWDDVKKIDREHRLDVLPRIAAMNLKKQPGGGVSVKDDVLAATQAAARFIKRQMFLYDADITVCCGTYWYLKEGLFKNSDEVKFKEFTTRQGIKYATVEGVRRSILIDYYHPAARIPSHFLLYALSDAVAEIMVENT